MPRPDSSKQPGPNDGFQISPDERRGFLSSSLKFFGDVLHSIVEDELLRVLWGVVVVLFLILVLMIWFGDLEANQRFIFALVIAGMVVVLFLVTSFRRQSRRQAEREFGDTLDNGAADDRLVEQVRRARTHLVAIRDANARNLRRSEGIESGHWARFRRDTYNNICINCHERRRGDQPPDDYFDSICPEPDVEAVCKYKWELGEALEDYRRFLAGSARPTKDFEELELQVRRSVIQPDHSPEELQAAVTASLAAAEEVLGN